jgi:hypothetical protein
MVELWACTFIKVNTITTPAQIIVKHLVILFILDPPQKLKNIKRNIKGVGSFCVGCRTPGRFSVPLIFLPRA